MDSFTENLCPWAAGGQTELMMGGFLQLLLASYCGIHNPNIWPKDKADDLKANRIEEYDFIVVGAGSAGSAVARRLAEENWSVLLLEAGGDPTPDSEIPAMVHGTQTSAINWMYKSEKNPDYCQAMIDQQCHIPRGKALGGSSAINYMLYTRGIKEDYDDWEKMGGKGWNYDSVMKHFRKMEGFRPISNNDMTSKDYGLDGPLNIETYGSIIPWKDLIKKAWTERGYNVMDHVNERSLRGITEGFGTVKNGQRWSSAKAYLTNLSSNLEKHLHVVRNAHVTKLMFDGDNEKVVGVTVKVADSEINVKASKEVILSAGAVNTPQILMLSGIGPKEHLKSIGVQPVIADLPVGQHLKDHVLFPIIITPDVSHAEFTQEMMVQTLLQYLLQRTGILGTVGMTDLLGYINTKDPDSSVPDIQMLHFFAPKNDTFFIPNMITGFMYDEEYTNFMKEVNADRENIYMIPSLIKPKSEGKIELRSLDPSDPVRIFVNHYEDQEDVDTMMKGIRFVEQLLQTKTLKAAGLKIRFCKLKNCPQEPGTDEYWKCMMKQTSSTVYHQVGTARMGPKNDGSSVVDPRLRVHGIKGLRVIDASIMPDIIRGNTNAPSIMIGEKGAELIKQDWSRDLKDEF